MDNNKISKKIMDRIQKANASFKAADNISEFINKTELVELEQEIKTKIKELLECFIIDVDEDIHLKDTATRMTKLFVHEILAGRYQPMPAMTLFKNEKKYENILILGPIAMRSLCSHHFAPIMGQVYVGIIPGENICGISKFSRLIQWYMAKPHVQENATEELANIIEETLSPKGVLVLVVATHFCMTWRGVKEHETEMTTLAKRGEFEQANLEKEFFDLLKIKGYSNDSNENQSI